MNRISMANKQIALWRFMAKEKHGFTDAELAKRIGCSASVLTHKREYYRMPYYQAKKLEELANEL